MTADAQAEQLLGRLGIAPAVPVPLDRVAAALGVAAVETAALVEDGRLEHRRGGPVILVRRGVTPARRRFTVAHELAHVVLGDAATERGCDAFAAALLLPRSWVRERYAGQPRTLASVRALAREAGVSVSAAVTRLDEVLGWRCGLLRFRREDGRWRFLGACAVPAAVSGTIRSAPGTSAALEALAGGRDRPGRVPVRVGGGVVDVEGEVSVRAGSALLLVPASAFRPRASL